MLDPASWVLFLHDLYQRNGVHNRMNHYLDLVFTNPTAAVCCLLFYSIITSALLSCTSVFRCTPKPSQSDTLVPFAV